MGEAAKAFWVNEEEVVEVIPEFFEDVSCLSTGVEDDCWKFGSD